MNDPNDYDFRKHRLYVDCDLYEGLIYTCTHAQANYLINVLRLKVGDEIYAFNGRHGEWTVAIEKISKKSCELRVSSQCRVQLSGPDIEYMFAPLKKARMDYIVQKATELGVSRIRPVITRRTIVDRVNTKRMKANVIEAAEQCGILRIPECLEPEKLDKILNNWDQSRTLIYCDERTEILNPISTLSELLKHRVSVLIGPEGGFDANEQDTLRGLPYVKAISLGPRIMRADTAAVAALSLVNAVVGDWGDFKN